MYRRQIDPTTRQIGSVLYDHSDDPYPGAVRIKGDLDVAWHVYGWEVKPDEDTEWSGCYNRTGQLVCVMVGDDQPFLYDPEDIKELAREDYCGICGQIGCGHDGLDRSES